jgi:hypothetical protein
MRATEGTKRSTALADQTVKLVLLVHLPLSLWYAALCACAGSATVVKTAVAC